jgi:hypothetical protein
MPKERLLNSCRITVNVFSGKRELMERDVNVLFTLRDGNQKEIYRKSKKTSSLILDHLPFFDNFGDSYTVLAWADGYRQAGFTPVPVTPQTPATVDLMLVPQDATFDFHEARWDLLMQNSTYARLLTAGAGRTAKAAQDRYSDVLENHPAVLAGLFNLVTALSQIHLPSGAPTDYVRELIWDDTMQQDRFFAWADPVLIDQVVQAARQGEFAPEVGSAIFHPGATRSYKQVQFGEANVQITFHEQDTATVQGAPAVKVEIDIDYYKDLAAHALLEVIHNQASGALTDPRDVYVLRWMAGRHAGVPNFEPPYRLA